MTALHAIRASIRLGVFLTVTMLCWPFYKYGRSQNIQRMIASLWFRTVGHIIGVKLWTDGHACHGKGPVLYVANHVSWLDIIVLGMKLDAVFVAKSDVADWPLLGRLARLRQCIFVSRKAAQVGKEAQIIRICLEAGRNVILFPEGTTGSGGGLLPFKSALLGALDGVPYARVQPVSIVYPDLENGGPDSSLAWFGDMAMLPHLWSVLGRGRAMARMHFHAPLAASDFPCRKSLAEACRAHIAGGVGWLLAAAQSRDVEDLYDTAMLNPPPARQSAAF